MIRLMVAKARQAWLQYRLTDVESRIDMVIRSTHALEQRLEEEHALLLKLRAQRTKAKAMLAGAGMRDSFAMDWRAPL